MEYKHICQVADGGCGRTYTSLEADPYFCKDCIQARKALYAQIEKRVAAVPRKAAKSDYEVFAQNARTVTQTLPDGTTITTSRMKA